MRAEVVKLVGFLVAAFPYAQVSKDTQRVYIDALSDLPEEILAAAIRQCVNDCEFFPTVAAIQDRVKLLASPDRLSGPEAWEVVVTALKSGQYYFTDPVFEDPLIQTCVGALDWYTLRASENPIADRAHFLKMYESVVAREKQNRKLLPSSVELRRQLAEQTGPRLLSE
jgi:hypothetical protein